jgi:hypothetical protein
VAVELFAVYGDEKAARPDLPAVVSQTVNVNICRRALLPQHQAGAVEALKQGR